MENIVNTAKDTAKTVVDDSRMAAQHVLESFGPLFDRLAGTQTEMKLSFEDLTLDTRTVQAKIQGYLVLSAKYNNTETLPKAGTSGSTENEGTKETKTVVTNVSM